MIYKTLKKVSNVCQLLDKSKYPATQTINGVTFTNNGDGTITANGTATGLCQYRITNSYKKIIGENTNKCLLVGSISANSGTPYYLQLDFVEGNSWSRAALDFGKGVIFTNSDSSTQLLSIIVKSGVTVNNLVFKPQLFDLTEMYGAGHESTTVEQFRQDFPEELYDYKPYCFVKSYKDCLKVSDVCQLLDKSKYPATTTKAGVTFTNNGDGSIVVNGTCTADTSFYVGRNVALKNGHQYLLFGAPIRGTWTTIIWTVDKLGSNDNPTGNRYTHKGDNTTSNCYIFVAKDFVADNLVFKPQFFDLTEMYGAGNEPTSVEQFRQDFPEELYDYKPYSIIPSYKTSLVCKTKNLFDINSVSNLNNWVNKTTFERPYGYYQFNLKPNTTYTFQRNYESRNNEVYACFYEEYGVAGGQWFIHPTAPSLTRKQLSFTTNDTGIMYLNVYRITGVLSSFIELIEGAQLELGDTATDYVPYGHL